MKWLYLLVCCVFLHSYCLAEVQAEEIETTSSNPLHSNGTNDTKPHYNLKDVSDSAGSMATLYKMSRQFAKAVGPETPIIDELLEYLKGNKTLTTDDVLQTVKMESGFMACLVLGLLMFFGLGIAGTFFCCCRCCCGNCGGKKVHRRGEGSNSSRKIYSFLLFVTLVLMLVALGCGYMVSTSLSKGILKSENTTISILDDTMIFFDTTSQELEDLAIGGVDQITQGIKDSLDNLQDNIGKPLLKASKEQLALFESTIKTIDSQLDILNKAKKDVNEEVIDPTEGITKKLKTIEANLKAIKTKCGGPCIDLITDATTLPEVKRDNLQELPNDIGQTLNTEINTIPQKVKDTTEIAVKDAKEKIDVFVRDFKHGEFRKTINESSEVTKFVPETKEDLKETFSSIRKYELNVYYTMTAVVSLVIIPVLLMCLGMCCGCAGHREARHPSERGSLSNCGGCTIITGVYLLFFLTGIPILVMTLLFQVGGHVETNLCSVAYQKDLNTFDKVFDYLKTKMKMEGDILKELAPSTTFQKCENNSALYDALNLESVFKLDTALDIKTKLNLEDKLKDITVTIEMDDITKNTGDVEKFDEGIFKELLTQLREKFDDNKYNEWIKNLEETKNAAPKVENDLEKLINQIKEIKEKEINKVIGKKNEIAEDLKNVNAEDLKKKAKELDTGIKSVLEAIKVKADKLKNEFFGNLEKTVVIFAENTTHEIKYNVGNCRQVWIIFDASRHLVCREILDPINAYWFCLGWALFFSIFAIIFGAKLSRHYVRMSDRSSNKWEDDLEPREYVSGSADGRPCIPMRESGMNYNNQGYHSPPPYAGPPPNYGYGHQSQPHDPRMQGFTKY